MEVYPCRGRGTGQSDTRESPTRDANTCFGSSVRDGPFWPLHGAARRCAMPQTGSRGGDMCPHSSLQPEGMGASMSLKQYFLITSVTLKVCDLCECAGPPAHGTGSGGFGLSHCCWWHLPPLPPPRQGQAGAGAHGALTGLPLLGPGGQPVCCHGAGAPGASGTHRGDTPSPGLDQSQSAALLLVWTPVCPERAAWEGREVLGGPRLHVAAGRCQGHGHGGHTRCVFSMQSGCAVDGLLTLF